MKHAITNLTITCGLSLLSVSLSAEEAIARNSMVDRGRYLLTVSGCNDCHTAGYAEKGGNIPESERLLGSPVGFSGPWGTTYPSNLRLLVSNMNEKQWLVHARKQRRPPMPWFNLRDMTDEDLKAIYAALRYLGPKGDEMPAYVPPDGAVKTAYIYFMPQRTPNE